MIIKRIIIVLISMLSLSGCVFNQEKITEKEKIDHNNIDEEKIVERIYGLQEYDVVFPNISLLAENSEVIVYGEVMEIEYVPGENGLCRTMERIKILQAIKGNYSEGEIIKVAKDQGILSVKEYLDTYKNADIRESYRSRFADYSDEELNDLYVEQIYGNDVMSEVGQRGVYFLIKSAFFEKEGTYARLTGPEGEYLEMNENQFALINNIGMEEKDASGYSLGENETAEEEVETYTLDEIISAAGQ